MLYLDSSALVKLVALEPESAALFAFLAERTELVSSAVAGVEVRRAVNRLENSGHLRARADTVLGSVALLRIDDAILAAAGALEPRTLRSLDALHLASALSVRDELEGFLAYDRGLGEAARGQGLKVLAPGARGAV